MIVHPADRPIVKWAIDQGYGYEYVREYGLPQPSLRVRLGLSTATFDAGQLIHWRADVDGRYLDQLMFELTCLFGLCALVGAQPEQDVVLSPQKLAALRRPSA